MRELCPDAREGPPGTDGIEPPHAPTKIPAQTSGARRDLCMRASYVEIRRNLPLVRVDADPGRAQNA
jgi:hypothetical protein